MSEALNTMHSVIIIISIGRILFFPSFFWGVGVGGLIMLRDSLHVHIGHFSPVV